MRNVGVLRYLAVGPCMMNLVLRTAMAGHPPSIEDTIVNVLIDADILREAIESFRVSQRFDLQVPNVWTPSKYL